MKIFNQGQRLTSYSVLLVASQITLCAGMPAVVTQTTAAVATTTPAVADAFFTPMVLVPVGMPGGPIEPMFPKPSISNAPAPAIPTAASGSVPLAAVAVPAANGFNANSPAVGSAKGRAALKTSVALVQASSIRGRLPMATSVSKSAVVAAVFATAAASGSTIPTPASVSVAAAASASTSASTRKGRQRLVVTKRDVQEDGGEEEEEMLHNLTFTTPSSTSRTVEGDEEAVEDNVLVHMTIHDDTITNVVPTLAGDQLNLVTFTEPRPNDLK